MCREEPGRGPTTALAPMLRTTLPGVIDLHVHVLPGIDDGPATLEESVELARVAALEGVEAMAATPHVRPDRPAVVPTELRQRCREVEARAGGPAIVPGGEVDLIWAQNASAEEL